MCFAHFDICTIDGPVHTQTLIKLLPRYSQHIGCNESWNGRVGPPKSPDMKLLDFFRDISKHCMYVDNMWNLLSLWEDCCSSRFRYTAGKNLVRVWLPFRCLQSYQYYKYWSAPKTQKKLYNAFFHNIQSIMWVKSLIYCC